MQRWLIAAAVTCVAATGCSNADREATPGTRRPQQAGQGTNPLTTAGHLAGVEVAGLSGDQRAMQVHINAMHKNLMRDMHLADASRRIDHEAARTAVRRLQGERLKGGVYSEEEICNAFERTPAIGRLADATIFGARRLNILTDDLTYRLRS